MVKNKNFRIEYIVLCIFAIFMITGSFSDKFISQHIVNQNSLIATFFQIFGSIAPPLILFISNSIICFYILAQLEDRLSKYTVALVSLIGSFYAMWQIVKSALLVFYVLSRTLKEIFQSGQIHLIKF